MSLETEKVAAEFKEHLEKNLKEFIGKPIEEPGSFAKEMAKSITEYFEGVSPTAPPAFKIKVGTGFVPTMKLRTYPEDLDELTQKFYTETPAEIKARRAFMRELEKL